MKNIINYLGALLAVLFIGASFTACSDDDDNGSAEVGLAIKVFFPTKVVTNQPITINGTGFADVTEIEFPNGVKVTDFTKVSNDMIIVKTPSGIDANGGKIIVRSANAEAQSALPLTVGQTKVTGYSKQPNDSVKGGELITVFGTDLEFVTGVELLNAEGNPQIIDHKDFYRKGTSNLIFYVPKKDIFEGTFQGILHTYDGQSIKMPELTYEPDAGGHMEIVTKSLWKNDGSYVTANWNGFYRFGLDGTDGNNECITTFPQDIWDQIKTGTFYAKFSQDADWYQIRITTGYWSVQWQGQDNDFSPNNMADRMIPNGDGTFYIEISFGDDPIVEMLDVQHLLFTGSGFSLLELYLQEEVWVADGEEEPSEYDIAPFTVYLDYSGNVTWPYFPSWGSDSGKLRIQRGGEPAIEKLDLTTSSKFVVYKKVGTTGQIQFNNPSWSAFAGVDCSDWNGDKETIEVPLTEDMLKWISGEQTDGSETAIILQGDGLEVSKIMLVP